MDQINSAVQIFNVRLKSLAQELNTILPNAKFTYIDYYGIEDSYIASFNGKFLFPSQKYGYTKTASLFLF